MWRPPGFTGERQARHVFLLRARGAFGGFSDAVAVVRRLLFLEYVGDPLEAKIDD